MIRNLKNKGLKLFWEKNDCSSLPTEWASKIGNMLAVLDPADVVPQNFAAFIGWKIHPLKGNLKGSGA